MVKKIGIAAVSSEGASLCYATICSEAVKVLGKNKHPEIFLHNPSFDTILEPFKKRDFKTVAKIISNSIKKLQLIGAEFAVIPSNAIHYAFDDIQKNCSIPILSIVEISAQECKEKKYKKVGILGVGHTMSGGLFDKPLKKCLIQMVIPDLKDQNIINDIIYKEIVPSKITEISIKKTLKIIEKLKLKGCDAVILACTELPIIINKDNCPLPFIDTTRLLAKKSLEYAIKK